MMIVSISVYLVDLVGLVYLVNSVCQVYLVWLVYLVYLVCPVYLVCLVYSVYLVCPVETDAISLMQSIRTMDHFVKS